MKNKSIDYISFKFNYSYYFYIFYKKDINFYFKSKVANKLTDKLKN